MKMLLPSLAVSFILLTPITTLAETLTSDLLVVERSITAAEWMRAHRHDTFQGETAAHPLESLTGAANCAVAAAQAQYSGATFTRRVFFRVPAAVKQLPSTDGPFPNLLLKCELSEIEIQTNPASLSPNILLTQLQKDFSAAAGSGKPFQPNDPNMQPLKGTGNWVSGKDWNRGGSRWIIAHDSSTKSIISVGIPKVSQSHDDQALKSIHKEIAEAQHLAATTGFTANAIQRMQTFLGCANDFQTTSKPNPVMDTPGLSPFLSNWVQQATHQPPDRRAAALYSADLLLARLPIEKPATGLLKQLATAGAQYKYDELSGGYVYSRNFLQQALRIAPGSPAGEQAFLLLLNLSFDPGCCASGNGFEAVIARTTQYLGEHPQTKIRGELLLALGDAYRDRIAVANGANGDPFNDSGKYKPGVNNAYHQALRYYRATIDASRGTDTANEASTKAWALLAGLPPLETRFARLYD